MSMDAVWRLHQPSEVDAVESADVVIRKVPLLLFSQGAVVIRWPAFVHYCSRHLVDGRYRTDGEDLCEQKR